MLLQQTLNVQENIYNNCTFSKTTQHFQSFHEKFHNFQKKKFVDFLDD
jgi:hypothetical protein